MAETETRKTAEDFIGLDMLYFAPLIKDDESGCTYGTPKHFAPVAQMTKTTTASSTPTYYDNGVYRMINDEAADELKLVTPALDLETLAEINGKFIDPTTGAFIDSGEPETRYFAVLARAKISDETHRFYCFSKVSFKVPDEDIATKKETAEPKGQELVATAVRTLFKYDQGGMMKGCKRIIVDERDGKVDVSKWFESVPVPGNIPLINAGA